MAHVMKMLTLHGISRSFTRHTLIHAVLSDSHKQHFQIKSQYVFLNISFQTSATGSVRAVFPDGNKVY